MFLGEGLPCLGATAPHHSLGDSTQQKEYLKMSFSVFLSLRNCTEWGPTVGNEAGLHAYQGFLLHFTSGTTLGNGARAWQGELDHISSPSHSQLRREQDIDHLCPKLIHVQPHIRNHLREHKGSLA